MESVTELVDPAVMRAQFRVGTVLREKWRLDAVLGVGGMATVFAATHRNEARAAIKLLHPELSVRPEVRSRFLREGRAANVIGHPGVVRVLDDEVDDDGSVYLVMELLDGETLEARATRQGGRLSVDEVLGAADQLLDVLAAAHARGIIHRDLKPENLFLLRNGQLKVLDFGIARLREMSASSQATRVGSILGTPSYMSPEQARGRWTEVDGRTDLWSVGATMFALLTGRSVHVADNVNEALGLAMMLRAPSVLSVDRTIPAPVADLVDRALAFERDGRWPDAQTMQQALREAYEAVHSGAPISSTEALRVPASVPDRTLPSAELPPGTPGATMKPVANGVTGVPLLRTLARLPRLAIAGLLLGSAVAIAGLVIGVVAKRASPDVAASASAPSSAEFASAPAQVPALPAPTIAPADGGTEDKTLSPEDLPAEKTGEPTAKPAVTSVEMKRLRANPYSAPRTPATTSKPKAAATTAPKPQSPPAGLADDPE